MTADTSYWCLAPRTAHGQSLVPFAFVAVAVSVFFQSDNTCIKTIPMEVNRIKSRRCYGKCAALRTGVSLIEVLVATAIIGLLLALIGPAIQQARESARKADCSSRMKQIGIAVHNYESLFGGIPISAGRKGPLAVLGTYLTDRAVMNEEMFPVIARCPSDPQPTVGVNYGINGGTAPDTIAIPLNGTWGVDGDPIRFNSITDGLSNTAMFAEWLRGNLDWFEGFTPPLPPPSRAEPRRLIYAVVMPRGSMMSVATAMSECAGIDPQTAPVNSTQKGCGDGGLAEHTCYFHELPPNSNSCYLAPTILGIGINAPSSFHGDGANLLLVDGSVKFITSRIDRAVWKALGTRAGNDRSTF